MALMHNRLKLHDCMLLLCAFVFFDNSYILFFKFIIDEILHTES